MRSVFAIPILSAAVIVFIAAPMLAVPPRHSPQKLQTNIQDVVKAVESRYHSSRTLKAVFLERYNEGRLTARVESGTVYFSRPGRMRWEYESPEQKLFLTDGKTTWFYVPADRTVSRISMKESSDWRTPLALLTGKANLTRYCRRLDFGDPPHDNSGNVTIRCVPADSPEPGNGAKNGSISANREHRDADQALSPDQGGPIEVVLMEVDPATGWLASVIIRQSGGVQIEYRFGKWQGDIQVPETMFHFVAPKGVAIVNGDASATSSH